MAAQTNIDWADSTFNGWIGCTKVSPACDNCYAAVATPSRTMSIEWGAGKPRHRTSAANWRQPLLWNANADEFRQCDVCGWRGIRKPRWAVCLHCNNGLMQPTRRRVFCSSLSDVFDNEVPAEWLVDLLDLIRLTPNLSWQILTKRIGNWEARLTVAHQHVVKTMGGGTAEYATHPLWALGMWIQDWLAGKPPANVSIGATICNQGEADRDVTKLLRVPAVVRFLSIEPMLGEVNMRRAICSGLGCGACHQNGSDPSLYKRRVCTVCDRSEQQIREDHGFVYMSEVPKIHQIITGGESGSHARPSNPQWFRNIRDYCAETGTAYFHKQNGEFVSVSEVEGPGKHFTFPDGRTVRRTGKKLAGRTLDGVTHNEFPRVTNG